MGHFEKKKTFKNTALLICCVNPRDGTLASTFHDPSGTTSILFSRLIFALNIIAAVSCEPRLPGIAQVFGLFKNASFQEFTYSFS
jgi:hypothetical protein